MKNKLLPLFFVVTFFLLSAPSASAVTNGVVKVGLRYGSSALASANLENAEGAGYGLDQSAHRGPPRCRSGSR